MNRTEALKLAKPILFNTEMVRAILDGRKTETRRLAKNIRKDVHCLGGHFEHEFIRDDFAGDTYTGFVCRKCGYGVSPTHYSYPVGASFIRPQYEPGDILYVRETFFECKGRFHYKADGKHLVLNRVIGGKEFFKWQPSIHMPKEAARIFLRVTDVRVERLQEITPAGTRQEGIKNAEYNPECKDKSPWVLDEFELTQFSKLWNSTIPKKDLSRYGWNANPWVWVYEFERIEVAV